MKVFVLNAGSSSLKFQIIDMDNGDVIIKGLCERIGIDDGRIETKVNGKKNTYSVDMPDHKVALKNLLDIVIDPVNGAISSLDEIDVVAHRVLHGGESFNHSVEVNDDVLNKIKELIPLGPLHQPANISGIEAMTQILPKVHQVVVFDTAFHSTLAPEAYRYAIPKQDYTEYGIRKYGFHGSSHKFVSRRLASILGKEGNFIILHIGSGASISAIENGKCVDTTMGYTPLDGCMMGTRSGSIDASIIPVLCEKHGFTVDQAITYLNKQSGYKGVAGYEDARDIEKYAFDTNDHSETAEDCRLAFNMRARVDKKFVGAYAAILGRVDAIAFTAGLGENGAEYREAVLANLENILGIKIDQNRNSVNFKRGEEVLISADDSKIPVYVIPTNEELQMAEEAMEVLGF